MRKFASVVALAAASLAPAQAATSIILNPGGTALPAYTTAQIVQNFTTANPDGSALAVNTTNTAGLESVKDPNDKDVRVFTTQAPALAGLAGDYLSIGHGSDYTISFPDAPVAFFSFAFNNIRNVNHLTLNYANRTHQQLNGIAMLGSPGVVPTFGRVSFDVGSGSRIASVEFSGGNAAFLIDSIAVAAPEPATWLMMILGFGLVGGLRRRRKRKPGLALATA